MIYIYIYVYILKSEDALSIILLLWLYNQMGEQYFNNVLMKFLRQYTVRQ
jgi:hypothetical protein